MKNKTIPILLGVCIGAGGLAWLLTTEPSPKAPLTSTIAPPATVPIVFTEPVPVPDTNGVPLPGATPFEDRPEAKAYYLKNYCDGYRLAAKATNKSYTTQCYFGPTPLPENAQAANAGWNAGQAAANSKWTIPIGVVER